MANIFPFSLASSKKAWAPSEWGPLPRHRKVFDVHQQQNPNKNPIKPKRKKGLRKRSAWFDECRKWDHVNSAFSYLYCLCARFLLSFCCARLKSMWPVYFTLPTFYTHTFSLLLFIHVICFFRVATGHSTFFGFDPKFVIRTCSIPDGHFSLAKKKRKEKRLSVADPLTRSFFFFFPLNFPIFVHTSNF